MLRGFSAWLLALYIGAGIGAPVADALVFHLGADAAPIRPALEELGSRALHGLCLLDQHAPESVTPTVASPAPVPLLTADRSPAFPAIPPRDAALDGLSLSRAPPRA